jgi:antitoxin VapB
MNEMKIAVVVNEPDGQVIHLPKDVHIDAEEVVVRQVGQSVVLTPNQASPWQPLLDSLDQFSHDFMEVRAQPEDQKCKAVFD